MIHNYEIDRSVIDEFMMKNFLYLGVIGFKRRMEQVLSEVISAAPDVEREALEKLHSPVGLDIGVESPEEITVSILAEIMQQKNAKSGQSLRCWIDYR